MVILLYYHNTLNLSIILCLFWGDIYISLRISLPNTIFCVTLSTVFILFYGKLLQTFLVL